MMRLLRQLTEVDIKGKHVLLRVDFNVAIEGDKITEAFKIEQAKETIEYLLYHGASVALAGHITAIDSFKPIAQEIARVLGKKMIFAGNCTGMEVASAIAERDLVLLENLRLNEGEKKNDPEFAKLLAKPFDLCVDDAFGVAHRKHASVCAVTEFLPSYAGFLIEKEIRELGGALNAPVTRKVLVLGGAKISTKLPVIKNFIGKAEKILLGGALVNNIYKYHGLQIGKSLFDKDCMDEIKNIPRQNVIVPEDVVLSTDPTGQGPIRFGGEKNCEPDDMILDIGPETARRYAEIIREASLVIWNGPMGKFEVPEFSIGTRVVAEACASAKHSIIGGGETIAAVRALTPDAKFSYVSTGGGAMLELLAGNRLPALEALGYYD